MAFVVLQRCWPLTEVLIVSIIRVGLAETKKFAEGYDAIFGKGKKQTAEEPKDVKKPESKAGKKKNKKK